MLRMAAGLLAVALLAATPAAAVEQKRNPFNDYHVVIMDGGDEFLGWIQLTQNGKDAGYIYLVKDKPRPPHLSHAKVYIVMDLVDRQLPALLTLLNRPGTKVITYFDSQTQGSRPSAMIELDGATAVLPADEAVRDAEALKALKAE